MHGYSYGLAIDLSSACDVRLCASDTKFGIMVSVRRSPLAVGGWPDLMLSIILTAPQEVKVGLAADIGTLQRFPKIVGNGSKARELALTGREFGAEEAKEIGFVSDVVQGSRKEVIGECKS